MLLTALETIFNAFMETVYNPYFAICICAIVCCMAIQLFLKALGLRTWDKVFKFTACVFVVVLALFCILEQYPTFLSGVVR